MRADVAVTAFRLLAGAKFDKLNSDEKPQLVKTFQRLKKAAADFEDLIKTAQERFKDEPDKKELLDATLNEEAAKEIEADIKPMTAEAFDRLVDSNAEWTLAQVDALHFVLVGEG